jgi:peptidoglycan/LPS O-acetylase OafA/YrhL
MEHVAETVEHSQPAQIKALTGIRGLAAFWVMLLHLQNYRPHGLLGVAGLRQLSRDGWLAVDLFFVLSGFIMMHVHGFDFVRPSLDRAKRFYLLRFIRIYPVHFVVLVLHVPLPLLALRAGKAVSASAFSSHSFLLSLFMLNGWGFSGSDGWNVPSWSVSSEWFAYLLFPLTAAAVHRVRTRRLALAIGIAILVSALVLGGFVSDWRQYMLPFWGVLVRVSTEFALGCLAYRFYTRPIRPGTAELAAELSLAAIVGISLMSLRATFNVLTIAAFVTLIIGLSQANGPVASVMKSRIMVYFGRISYSAYIVHALVLAVYARAIQRIASNAGLGVETLIVIGFAVLVVASAHVLYSMVEEPARRWLRGALIHPAVPPEAAMPSD